MKLFSFKKPVDLNGYTLIIPSVSVGNVPQLTVDLLITTLKLENAGTLWHPGIVASVGADPFYSDDKTVCTACEIYINESMKLATIQLRSTIETKLVLKFLNDLIESIRELQFSSIYLLTTGFDYELHNIANKNTYYYATNNKEREQRIQSVSSTKPLEPSRVNGAGFGPKLYEAIGNRIPTILLLKYISEGENIHDAKCFLEKLLDILQIKVDSIDQSTFPASWRYVHGAPPPLGLF